MGGLDETRRMRRAVTTSLLVGLAFGCLLGLSLSTVSPGAAAGLGFPTGRALEAVSYTHLTLPTIYSV